MTVVTRSRRQLCALWLSLAALLAFGLGARAHDAPVAAQAAAPQDDGAGGTANQDAAAPPDEALFVLEELEFLVAPVALYPDPLLAAVLQASTVPLQVVEAKRFLGQLEAEPEAAPSSDWDPSILAILNYPQVVERMDANLDWIQALGDAVLFQLGDLQDAVQQVRLTAYTTGALASNEYQEVVANANFIRIRPTSPDQIAVPVYDGIALIEGETPEDAAAQDGVPAETDLAEAAPPIPAPKPAAPVAAEEDYAEGEEVYVEPVEQYAEPAPAAPVEYADVPDTYSDAPVTYAPAPPGNYVAPPVAYAAPQPSFWGTAATITGGVVVGNLVSDLFDDSDDDWDDFRDDYDDNFDDLDDQLDDINDNLGDIGDSLEDIEDRRGDALEDIQKRRDDRLADIQAGREDRREDVQDRRDDRVAKLEERRKDRDNAKVLGDLESKLGDRKNERTQERLRQRAGVADRSAGSDRVAALRQGDGNRKPAGVKPAQIKRPGGDGGGGVGALRNAPQRDVTRSRDRASPTVAKARAAKPKASRQGVQKTSAGPKRAIQNVKPNREVKKASQRGSSSRLAKATKPKASAKRSSGQRVATKSKKGGGVKKVNKNRGNVKKASSRGKGSRGKKGKGGRRR
jgi:hypothetical protein